MKIKSILVMIGMIFISQNLFGAYICETTLYQKHHFFGSQEVSTVYSSIENEYHQIGGFLGSFEKEYGFYDKHELILGGKIVGNSAIFQLYAGESELCTYEVNGNETKICDIGNYYVSSKCKTITAEKYYIWLEKQ